MAIALVQKANGTSTTATTTASFGVAPTSGNLVVLTFASDDYNASPNAGWTQSTGMEQQTFHGGYIWWRISDGSNSLQYTIGSATRSSWTLREFSGVNPTPYDISNGTFTQASGGTQATPNITPTAGDRLLVGGWGFSAGSNLTGFTGTASNSFTDLEFGGVGTIDVSVSAYLLVTANGSTAYGSTFTQTVGSTPQARSGLVIAFTAAAAGGTTFTAAAGSYALTGSSAGVAGRAILSAGSYTITGGSAGLAGKAIVSAGSYTLTGSPVTFQGKWPDATNTGYAPGTSFTLFDSDTFRSSTNGEVIENLHLTNADMIVTHDNVTIRNCWFDSAAANNALRVYDDGLGGGNNVLIEDCTFDGHDNCTNAMLLNGATGATVLRCNISGVDNGVNVGTHNTLIRDCYIHDLNNTVAGDPHYDCIEVNAGIDNLIIRHCALWNDTQSQTACINLNNFFGSGSSNSQLIDNCLIIDGGSSPIYSDGRFQSEPMWNVTVQDCIIRPSALWGYTALVDNTINWQWINNRDESNAVLPNPAPQVGVIYDGDSYALTGTAASFVIDTAGAAVVVTANAGDYALTGTSAGLAGKAVAAGGAYTLTGTAATFITGGDFTLFCEPGAYTISGTAATFPGYDVLPPQPQPSPGSGYAGAWAQTTRRKRKRDEIEELIDAVLAQPAQQIPQIPQIPQPPSPALIELMPKMQAAGLTPPQRKIVKRAVVTDDPDDDEEAIELLLNLLS
jgi:hypothetical protein